MLEPRNQCLGKLGVSLDEKAQLQALAIEQDEIIVRNIASEDVGEVGETLCSQRTKGSDDAVPKTAPTPRGPKTKFNPLVVILLFIERPSSRG